MQAPHAPTLWMTCARWLTCPKRTVRYYIQIGLVGRPTGETRAAHYSAAHLEQLIRIRKWTGAGVTLERIREILAGADAPVPPKPRQPGAVEVRSHLLVADGVELSLEPGRAGLSPGQARALFRSVLNAYNTIVEENKNVRQPGSE